MTTAASDPQIVPRPPASLPALRVADQGVADALESVLSDNTRRVYQTQWKLFDEWCNLDFVHLGGVGEDVGELSAAGSFQLSGFNPDSVIFQ